MKQTTYTDKTNFCKWFITATDKDKELAKKNNPELYDQLYNETIQGTVPQTIEQTCVGANPCVRPIKN